MVQYSTPVQLRISTTNHTKYTKRIAKTLEIDRGLSEPLRVFPCVPWFNSESPLPLSFRPRNTWNELEKHRRLRVVSNPAVFRGSTPDTTDATCLQSHVWPHYLIWQYVRTRHLDPCLPNVRPCHSPDGYNDCASSRDGAGHLPSITEYAGTARVLSSYISS